ncbi:hypothetical protein OS493_029964 [Desmophyllum pertusum]|uniref:Uncharacterized protein n=1 Tax=Desmophyllum pertusum TaxID=174260 RepID=A0A9X0D7H2_9CNID|nr:hypothetical protein OS493_029964 [Desmophyllum pertusum]
MEENLAEENDHGLDDRETRLDNDNGNRNFDGYHYNDQTDDDLFFLQDDDEVERKRKSGADYSEWDTTNRFNYLNDDAEEKKKKKEEEKEEEEAEKGMFKKLFNKFKNWIGKLGKRRIDE